MNGQSVSALRPLAGVRDAIATLRIGGGADPEAERHAFLRVCSAVEASLRRMLRDLPDAPIETRLRALAADEMAADEVVAVLRQKDRLTLESAAAVHDLTAARRRVGAGEAPAPKDVELAVSVVAALEREAYSRPPSRLASPAPASEAPGPTRENDRPQRDLVSRRDALVPVWVWTAAGVVIVGILLLGMLWGRGSSGPDLSEGIALFRTGDFARAATAFEAYVAARPDDPTGRLYLARVYRRLDRREEAGSELRRGLDLAPTDAALHRELGLLLLDAGQADAAVGRFRTAVEHDPGAIDGWLGLIRALRESGQHAAAENVIARAPPEVRALVRTAQ